MMFSPVRRVLREPFEVLHPFRHDRCSDVFEGAGLGHNEHSKVLFLACEDLGNVLCSAASKSAPSKIEFHLNHSSPAAVARNVLILSLISEREFNIEKDAEFLWDITYNGVWSNRTKKRFVHGVKRLLNSTFDELHHVKIARAEDFDDVKRVAAQWLSILENKSVESFKAERRAFFQHETAKSGCRLPNVLSDFCELVSYMSAPFLLDIEKKITLGPLPQSTRESMQRELSAYYLTATTNEAVISNQVAFNPMFLDRVTQKWNVPLETNPFYGFVPFREGELNLRNHRKDNVLKQSCLNIFKRFVGKLKEREKNIEFFFYIRDPLELCLDNSIGIKFDVIDSSNLADYCGLANVLNAGFNKLAVEGSRLYTDTDLWQEASPILNHFVERVLCCPLSMTPTIYGLSLANNPLDIDSKPRASYSIDNFIRLIWSRAPRISNNVSLTLSMPLVKFMRDLADKCFAVKINETDSSATQFYTPLTYFNVLHSLKSRLLDGGPRTSISLQIPNEFRLYNRAIEDCANGRSVTMYSMKSTPFILLNTALVSGTERFLCLRAVLVRRPNRSGVLFEDLLFFHKLQNSEVDFVDNVRVKVERNRNGWLGSIEYSFILPTDYKLDEDRCYCSLVDAESTSLTVVPPYPLSTFSRKTVKMNYPFRTVLTGMPKDEDLNEEKLSATCSEMEDHYLVSIHCPSCDVEEKNFKVSADTKWPCRSSYSVSVNIGRHFLNLTLSHPVVVADATSSIDGENVKTFIPKAINELWPCDRQQDKLQVKSLKCWVESKDQDLDRHLEAQFCDQGYSLEAQYQLDRDFSPIRTDITFIFSKILKGKECFSLSLCNVGGDTEELWLRAHLPIRTSPSGAPLVLLTVFDKKRAQELEKSKKIKNEYVQWNVRKVFGMRTFNLELMIVPSPEMMKMWRHVLLVNSLKISKTDWPISNLSTGESSPWMVSFLTPLYIETSGVHFYREFVEKCSVDESDAVQHRSPDTEEHVVKELRCANCGKMAGSKRCGRCKSTSYCSVQCQKKDWQKHKKDCEPH